MEYRSYFRPEIDAMAGYAPGEQPKDASIIKLNTNENPYPPSPLVEKVLAEFDYSRLRLYPDPTAFEVRAFLGDMLGFSAENIIAGNGSDDILTIVTRCFSGAGKPLASFNPSYSLYPELARLQNAPCRAIELTDSFDLPPDALEQLQGANLLMLANPNAPTGKRYPSETIEKICAGFRGMVLIDEAYADFAEDTSLALVKKYPNAIVSRTFSKSRSLAGLRFGFAVAHPKVIEGMMKMKDSYNVPMLTQSLALASLRDKAYFEANVAKIKESRRNLSEKLETLGFEIVKSETNFLFARVPMDAAGYFAALKENRIFVRYFPAPRTRDYVRITIGTPESMETFLSVTKTILGNHSKKS